MRVAVVVLIALASCAPFTVCSTDTDCGANGVCQSGVCVIAGGGAGGTAAAGGSVTAGGAATAGGSSAGGSTAGGKAGGAAGGSTLVDAGSDSGVADAGTDAGVDAGEPDAGSCPICPGGFSCDSTSRTCLLNVVGIGFVRPDANDVYGASQPIRLLVRAFANATVVKPSSLPLTGPNWLGQTLALDSNGDWVLDGVTPIASGTFPISTRWDVSDAGFVANSSITVDARVPVISVSVEPAPIRVHDGGSFSERDSASGFTTAFKRDEFAELRVESNVAVQISNTDVFLPAGSVTARANCSTQCAGGRFCNCFTVDLARVPLPGLRAVLDAGVGPVRDLLGNQSAPAFVAIPVTRWRWRRILLEQGRTAVDKLFPPALDDDGRIHIGVGYQNTNEGSLIQVAPNGDVRFDNNIEDIQLPPIVEGRVAIAQGDNQQFRRYDTTQPTAMPQQLQQNANNFCGNSRYGALGTVADGRMFFLSQFSGQVFTGLRVGSMACDEWWPPADADALGGVIAAVPLVTSASRLFYARRDGRSNTGMMRVDHYPMATTRFQNARSFPSPNGASSIAVFGEVVATSSANASPVNTTAVSAWNPELTARVDARTISDAGTTFGPLVAAGTRTNPLFLVGDATGALHRIPYTAPAIASLDAGVFGTELTPVITGLDSLEGGSAGSTAPVIGGNGLVYVISPVSGRLSVVNIGNGALEWSAPLVLPAGAVSPALDVLRDKTSLAKQCSRGLGVLYLAARNDSALTAVIVDSPGLDGMAPWPRFHHDNGSTGYSETPLSAWSCP